MIIGLIAGVAFGVLLGTIVSLLLVAEFGHSILHGIAVGALIFVAIISITTGAGIHRDNRTIRQHIRNHNERSIVAATIIELDYSIFSSRDIREIVEANTRLEQRQNNIRDRSLNYRFVPDDLKSELMALEPIPLPGGVTP